NKRRRYRLIAIARGGKRKRRKEKQKPGEALTRRATYAGRKRFRLLRVALRLLLRRRHLLRSNIGLRRRSVHVGAGPLIAREVWLKRRHLEGHLLPRGNQANRFRLQERDRIVPGIEFDARTDRKSGNLVEIVWLERRRVGDERIECRNAIAEARIDQSGQSLRFGVKLLVEEAG